MLMANATTTLTLDTRNASTQQQNEITISTAAAPTTTPATTAAVATTTTTAPSVTVLASAVKRLPTVPGLKVRAITQPQLQYQQQQQQQQQQNNQNCLLKLQLRSDLKELQAETNTAACNTNVPLEIGLSNDPCAALQSLATVAERQAPNAIQPPSSNNLQHQFLLHMATNPLLNKSHEFLQHQQQQQQQQSTEDQPIQQDDQIHNIADDDDDEDDGTAANLELILDSNDGKSDPEFLLNDDIVTPHANNEDLSTTLSCGQSVKARERTRKSHKTSNPSKPVQRRRIRRKAQSTIDDQAEHLTEMSVRGLDLFRYASITEGVYQCTECAKENVQKTFKNKYSFQRHAFLYHEGKHRKVFPCLICGKEFSRPDKMKNHLKMTHDGFVSKDMTQLSALNYLINATAVGDIQPQVYTVPQQQTSGEQQQQQQQQQQTTTEASNDAPNTNNLTSSATEPALALMKLQNDIMIKDELIISPSPSPPPAPPPPQPQQSLPMVVIARGTRLEEVK